MITKLVHRVDGTVELTFEIDLPGSQEVALVCDANGWVPIRMRAIRRGQGTFRSKLVLADGQEAEFRYLIDSEIWENDDHADEFRPNPFGTENSVVRASV